MKIASGSQAKTELEHLWARKIADGDIEVITSIIQECNQQLFRVARAILRNESDAEEVLHDAYLKAFGNMEMFRGHARLQTWLTRIVINEARSRQRTHNNRRRLITEMAPKDDEGVVLFPGAVLPRTPEAEMVRKEIRGLLENAIDTLSEVHRVVVVLRDIEGCTTDEVAEILGIKPQTVKTRLHRAHLKLREYLKDEMAAEFPELYPFGGDRCARLAEAVIAKLALGGSK